MKAIKYTFLFLIFTTQVLSQNSSLVSNAGLTSTFYPQQLLFSGVRIPSHKTYSFCASYSPYKNINTSFQITSGDVFSVVGSTGIYTTFVFENKIRADDYFNMISLNADIGYRYRNENEHNIIANNVYLKFGAIARHNWLGFSVNYKLANTYFNKYESYNQQNSLLNKSYRVHSHVDFKLELIYHSIILNFGTRVDMRTPKEIHNYDLVSYFGLEVNFSTLLPKNR